jgi:peptidoglycan L-alanyl-D-glutamate endopeptidase CwlK
MTPADEAKLRDVDPRLAAGIAKVLTALDVLGHPMMVTTGFRTTETQQKLYALGRTMPGHKVTNANGVTTRSRHQDGYAVDCAFVVSGQPSWADALPWDLYGACVEAVGLVWGGRFATLHDRPHAELPKP